MFVVVNAQTPAAPHSDPIILSHTIENETLSQSPEMNLRVQQAVSRSVRSDVVRLDPD